MPRRSRYPGPHPDPPVDLATRRLPIIQVSERWFRLHGVRHSALFFGTTGNNRFDAPDEEFGVLYVGDSPRCTFIETYGRVERESHRLITVGELANRHLTVMKFGRPLNLVDLAGAGLSSLGADNRLCTGDYRTAQHWSLALWSHPDVPDGLLYRSRHDPSRICAALFDRGINVILHSLGSLADPDNVALLADILDTYEFGLLD